MKTTKTIITLMFLGVLLCLPFQVAAQVTIGFEKEPDPNAILDLRTTDGGLSEMGLLLPRVELVSTTDATPLTAPITPGMFVYNTTPDNGSVSPGIYYHNGTVWVRLMDGGIKTPVIQRITNNNSYSITSDTDVVLCEGNASPTITLPTNVPVGKQIIFATQDGTVDFTNSLFSNTLGELTGGMSAILMYVGGASQQWLIISGL